MTNKYSNDFDCLRSLTAVRDKLYYEKKSMFKPSVITNSLLSSKDKKSVVNTIDFSTDDSVILAIQNDNKFMNIIMNCRKQKSPLAYIFVESEYHYISCIIKNPDGFPLILIRIPINKKFVYAKNVNNCYEFPLTDIINKDIKYNKSYSYTLMFRNNGQNIQFVYELFNNNSEPTKITIDNVNVGNQSLVDNIFKYENMISIHSFNNISHDNKESLLTFNNMTIKILTEVNSINNTMFNNKQAVKVKNYFELTSDKFVYVSETNKKHSTHPICTNENSIYFNNIDSETKLFKIMPFESLFKINYNKSITTNDKIYYIFTSFINNYMFIKMITPLEINKSTVIETLIKTFTHDYQIIECYMCTLVDDMLAE